MVANRLPITVQRGKDRLEVRRSSGGLVSALDPALRSHGGTWVGWPGLKLTPDETLELPGGAYRLLPIELSQNETRRYYHGFSNGTLWPLFHCLPERASFDSQRLRRWPSG